MILNIWGSDLRVGSSHKGPGRNVDTCNSVSSSAGGAQEGGSAKKQQAFGARRRTRLGQGVGAAHEPRA